MRLERNSCKNSTLTIRRCVALCSALSGVTCQISAGAKRRFLSPYRVRASRRGKSVTEKRGVEGSSAPFGQVTTITGSGPATGLRRESMQTYSLRYGRTGANDWVSFARGSATGDGLYQAANWKI